MPNMRAPCILLIYRDDGDTYTLVNKPGLPVTEDSPFTLPFNTMDKSMANVDLLTTVTETLRQEKQFKGYAFLQSWYNHHSDFYFVMLRRVNVYETENTGFDTVTGPNDGWVTEKNTATIVDCESTWHNDEFDENAQAHLPWHASHEKWNTGKTYVNPNAKVESGREYDYSGRMTPVTLWSKSAHTEAPAGEGNMISDADCVSTWDSTRRGSGDYDRLWAR